MLRAYLEGLYILIRTEDQALKWALNLKPSTGRSARWRLRLKELNFEIVQQPGKYHKAADALSGLPRKTSEEEKKNQTPMTKFRRTVLSDK